MSYAPTDHPFAKWMLAVGLCLGLATAAPAHAQEESADPFTMPETVEDFTAEIEFFKVESEIVTSVSRHPESLWEAAAAIYVVTGEEIRLSGAQSLPEALRMVPGLDVASIDRNTWAVSARGLNNTFADKMLVLLDGRPIYTPLFGGTLWHLWNTFLPDIDRIEVIRGPGGTLWGSNAMNGVINIITKTANDTEGVLLRAEGGSNYQFLGEGRYGGHHDELHYRVWARGATDEGFGGDEGDDIDDAKDEARGGYRFDWDFGRGLRLLSTAEYYNATLGSVNRSALGTTGDFGDEWDNELITTVWRMEKDFANGSSAHLQLAGDYIDQSVPWAGLSGPAGLEDAFNTIRRGFEAELQHGLRPARRHRLTWGTNYRYTNVDVNDSVVVGLDIRQDELHVVGGFLQDEIDLWKGGRLTLGTKIEYNNLSNTDAADLWQPSARFVQSFGRGTAAWAAVSRAINTPSYGDMFTSFAIPPSPLAPNVTSIFAADRTFDPTGTIADIDDTELLAYEAGVRHRFGDTVSLDVACFYNDYDGIMTFSGNTMLNLVDPTDPTSITSITFLDNAQDGESYGIESVLDVHLADWLTAQANVTWQEINLDGGSDGQAPEWKVNFRPVVKPWRQLTVVPTVHYVDSVSVGSIFGAVGPSAAIDDYVRFDLAVHYQPVEGWPTISFVGQNLNDRRHNEFSEQLIRPTSPVTRSWFIRVEQAF